MPKARIGDLEIAYETSGDPAGVPIILIMGLGAQLIMWADAFVAALVSRGHYVIRFDNRDVGQSTHLSHLQSPKMLEALMAVMSGQNIVAPYSLQDMAGDVIGLLDALGIESAHVTGASMGGMISQVLALNHPTRVRSLTSIMSTTNDRDLPTGDPTAMQSLIALFGSDAGENIDSAVQAIRILSSPGYPFDEARARRVVEMARQRGFSQAGVARQFLAILLTPGRREALRNLRIPTLVIHGESDPLVPLAAGKATADAIPGARLWAVPGMGHDMPAALYEPIAAAISEHAMAAEAARKASPA